MNTCGFTLLADVTTTATFYNTQVYSDQTRHDNGGTFINLDPSLVATYAFFFDDPSGGQVFMSKVLPQSPLTGILNLDVTNSTVGSQANQTTVSDALASTINVASQLGSLRNRISNQQSFNAALSDALNSGVGSLVDADMNVASTRLQALQTQQQLGVQALSIANDNSAMILKLFG